MVTNSLDSIFLLISQNTLADEFLLDMNDLEDAPIVKKEEEEIEGMDDGVDFDQTPEINKGKLSNIEIEELIADIVKAEEKASNQVEHELIVRANEMIARINLEIANIYRVCFSIIQ
jgi:hypothetical protein